MAVRFDGRITGPGDLSKYTEVQCCAPDRLQIVTDPIGQRGYVLRAARQIDDTVVRNGYRAEVYANAVQRVAPFTEWYEWESLVRRSEFVQGWPAMMILFQIHDAFSGGGTPHLPPIELGVNESWFRVVVHSSAMADPQVASDVDAFVAVQHVPMVWDRWARVVIRSVYKLDGTGELDVWYDGKRACALRNIYNAYPTNPLFVQTGAYSGLDQLRAPVSSKVVYSTGVRIFDDATTHAEMGVSADIPLVSSGGF